MPIETTENFVRVRQIDPSLFQKESFRTILIDSSKGIKAVIGRRPGSKSTEIQTFLFDKDKWTVEEAKTWLQTHKNNASARDTQLFQKFLKHGANMASARIENGKIVEV